MKNKIYILIILFLLCTNAMYGQIDISEILKIYEHVDYERYIDTIIPQNHKEKNITNVLVLHAIFYKDESTNTYSIVPDTNFWKFSVYSFKGKKLKRRLYVGIDGHTESSKGFVYFERDAVLQSKRDIERVYKKGADYILEDRELGGFIPYIKSNQLYLYYRLGDEKGDYLVEDILDKQLSQEVFTTKELIWDFADSTDSLVFENSPDSYFKESERLLSYKRQFQVDSCLYYMVISDDYPNSYDYTVYFFKQINGLWHMVAHSTATTVRIIVFDIDEQKRVIRFNTLSPDIQLGTMTFDQLLAF